MALSGATANVQPYVLDFAERVGARAGIRQPVKVLSGYRPGATIINTDRPSLHASGRAVDLGVYYGRTLTRLGQAALAEAGGDSRRRTFAGTVNGWEIIFNSFVGGNHFDHLHVGWEGAGVPQSDRREPSSSSALSRQQLADVWLAAGGNPRAATMAAAVATRESGGRPNAHNLSSREDSRGLWQINVRAHPQWAIRNLYSPRVNAQAAIAISRNGRDWSPWTTAAAARQDVQGITGTGRAGGIERPGGEGGGGLLGGIGGLAGDVLGGVTGVFKDVWGWGDALVALVTFLVNPLNWLRLFEVVAGFTLMLAGVGILVAGFLNKPDSELGKAAGTAASIIPAARAGAALKGASRA